MACHQNYVHCACMWGIIQVILGSSKLLKLLNGQWCGNWEGSWEAPLYFGHFVV